MCVSHDEDHIWDRQGWVPRCWSNRPWIGSGYSLCLSIRLRFCMNCTHKTDLLTAKRASRVPTQANTIQELRVWKTFLPNDVSSNGTIDRTQGERERKKDQSQIQTVTAETCIFIFDKSHSVSHKITEREREREREKAKYGDDDGHELIQ